MTIGPIGLGGIDALYFELAEMQDDQRKAARDTRRGAQAAQVDALMDQADHTEKAAVLEGIGSILEGAGTAVGGAFDATAGASAQSQQHARGGSELASAAGTAGAGFMSIAAGYETADGQRCAARATAQAAQADDARAIEEDAGTSRETLLRRLETAQGLQNDIRSASLRA